MEDEAVAVTVVEDVERNKMLPKGITTRVNLVAA
jgi:hypothetical protein